MNQSSTQGPEGSTSAPPSPAPRAARSARARTPTRARACRATRVLAGIAVDHAAGQRRHRRRRQHLPRLHRRHRRQRARPLPPDARERARRTRSAKASVGSFTSRRARRADRAPRPPRRRRRASTALQLYSGGAEAVESALRLAKCAHGQVRDGQLLGRLPRQDDGRAVAHGLDVQGQARARWSPARTSSRTPTATAARSGSRTRRCGVACAEVGRKQLKTAGAGAVAAVIVEPMQGTAGNVIPPEEFLPAVRSIADELRRARSSPTR